MKILRILSLLLFSVWITAIVKGQERTKVLVGTEIITALGINYNDGGLIIQNGAIEAVGLQYSRHPGKVGGIASSAPD